MFKETKIAAGRQKQFCTECGKELKEIGEPLKYERDTGLPIYEMICPTEGCKKPVLDHSFGGLLEGSMKSILASGSIIETGVPYFDDPAGGMTRGELTSIGGRPGHGKSTIMLNILDSMARKGLKILLFNRELSNAAALNKLLVMNNPYVTYTQVRHRVLSDTVVIELKKTAEEIKEIYKNVIMYDDIRDLNESVAAIKKYEPDVFIDDYIQLIRVGGPRQERRFDIEEVMHEYKWVAKKTNSAGLLISQLSRDVEKRLDHTPMMGDFAEGGTIEQASENAVFIQHPFSFDPMRYGPETSEIIFKKCRYGKVGTYRLKFLGEKCKFEAM